MLQLKNIKKTYTIGEFETKALDDISISFREKEFVAILGASGSGKTTCLNIIGGLDRYDSGDLLIKGKSTKDFKEREWDAYRNNSVGFVFQNYNLISHLSIVANVELGMTLSGVSKAKKHKKALEVLERVGLKEHLHKKPTQLSGGQMQRVAIARALANDPEILLCDEPTGALDTNTSVQIMDLIKELSQDRLVIMVTHNPELAEKYANRIVRFTDGKITDDTNPYEQKSENQRFDLKKTSMNFFTALGLSFNNLKTKKGRTFLTSFASSIGIIGIAVILSLSNGFQKQIDKFQNDTMAEFPILISRQNMNMDMESMTDIFGDFDDSRKEMKIIDMDNLNFTHANNFSDEYLNYIKDIDPEIAKSVGYTHIINMNLLSKKDGEVSTVSFAGDLEKTATSGQAGTNTELSAINGISSYPNMLKDDEESYLADSYDLLAGELPTKDTDLVFVIGDNNLIYDYTLEAIGIDTEGKETIPFDEIIGKEFKLVKNNDYFVKGEFGNFMPNPDLDTVYDNENNITLKISCILRPKSNSVSGILQAGISYNDNIAKQVLENSINSDIVKAQKESDINLMTMQPFNTGEKEALLSYLGATSEPYLITVYPRDFKTKEKVVEYLDSYNENKADEDQVLYTDLSKVVSSLSGGIMNGITIVLIAFASISLVVSLIMIGILTYTSVLERTKEIGVLRSLGARKKDISRVFNAETFILGIFSGILGILIAYALTFPINSFLYNMTSLENVAQLNIIHAVILLVLSTLLTVLGGFIPAKIASRKNAVEALRTE